MTSSKASAEWAIDFMSRWLKENSDLVDEILPKVCETYVMKYLNTAVKLGGVNFVNFETSCGANSQVLAELKLTFYVEKLEKETDQ